MVLKQISGSRLSYQSEENSKKIKSQLCLDRPVRYTPDNCRYHFVDNINLDHRAQSRFLDIDQFENILSYVNLYVILPL